MAHKQQRHHLFQYSSCNLLKRVSNRLIFMDEGKILEDCPTHEFFDNLEARHERAKIFLEKIQAMH
ncbi:hypothetical protein IAF27_19940, partial [Acinetobacter baumannii]|nr:hypothetical protein [Acinetobacter baumannii]